MKTSSATARRRPLSRQTAWGCFTTNLAMPGLGTLAAGRISGYPQAALGFCGLAMTLTFGSRFVMWYIRNWNRIYGGDSDPLSLMGELWREVRWPLIAIGIFAAGWLWALASSSAILREAKRAERPNIPPPLLK